MKDVKIVGDTNLDPAVWDYLMNHLSKVKNRNYETILVEIGSDVLKKKEIGLLGSERNLVLAFDGFSGGQYIDLVAKDGRKEIRLPLAELKGQDMKKKGWKPIYNSKRDTILIWSKPPYLLSCIDLRGVGLSKPVKDLIKFFIRKANGLNKFEVKIDFSDAERQLASYIRKTKRGELATVKRRADSLIHDIEAYNDRLAELHSDLRKANVSLRAAEKISKEKVNVKGILKNVLNIKGVKLVNVENSQIVIYTYPLKSLPFSYGGRKRTIDLGSFKISWGDGKPIRIRNLERRRGYEYDHPHIRDGQPCWGNMREITQYAQNFNIEVVAQMILSYLEHLNPQGWHTDGIEWSKNFRGR
ncbi:hypothetical protein GTO27_03440 [Candidatus Bathyarchaeota archaeon]|nr:hypothetical protein [Candidatus Bathyarchaeota archaeon]